MTAQDITATADVLTVDVVKGALIYVDDIDKIQNRWSAANKWGDEMGRRLAIGLDAQFLYQVLSANNTIDDGDLGGTAGNGITLTVSNIVKFFTAINKVLDVNNVPLDARHSVISPQVKDVLIQYLGGKESALGDKTSKVGSIGRYMGLELYLSNNSTCSAQWLPADNPTDTATISITEAGGTPIVFTFNTTPSGAGSIDIGANTAATLDNLVALINNGGVGDGTNNISLSTTDQKRVQDWVAVDGTTYIEVRVKGGSYLTVTTSEVADVWTATEQIQHILAGRDKAIDAVIQKTPGVKTGDTIAAGKAGINILGLSLAGFRTFNQGKNEIVDAQVRFDAF